MAHPLSKTDSSQGSFSILPPVLLHLYPVLTSFFTFSARPQLALKDVAQGNELPGSTFTSLLSLQLDKNVTVCDSHHLLFGFLACTHMVCGCVSETQNDDLLFPVIWGLRIYLATCQRLAMAEDRCTNTLVLPPSSFTLMAF